MQDARPLDLRAFDEEVQAQADLLRLREEIKIAEAQRDAIRELARHEGLELGRQDALEQASKAERERVAAETAGLSDLLRKIGAGLEAKRAELAGAAERDLIKLALAVAAKIVKAEILRGGPVARENLRRAVELTARRQDIKVVVHPADLARLSEFLPELRREFSDLQNISLEAGDAVGVGGALVQTREGSVDASVATQLEEIERGLLG
jgi:flagellar assembly protein FliH